MGALKDKLLAPGVRANVLADCVQVIEEEVAGKGGITGLAIKGAYKMVKAVGPNIVREAMDGMLNDFTSRLEPFFEEWQQKGAGTPLGSYLSSRSGQVANALLGITDDRAKKSQHKVLKGAYEKLRPQAVEHIGAAMPRLADLIAKHAS